MCPTRPKNICMESLNPWVLSIAFVWVGMDYGVSMKHDAVFWILQWSRPIISWEIEGVLACEKWLISMKKGTHYTVYGHINWYESQKYYV
jgi:hypothetical protein